MNPTRRPSGRPRKPDGSGRAHAKSLSVNLDTASEAALATLQDAWRPNAAALLAAAQVVKMALCGAAMREAPEAYASEIDRVTAERQRNAG